MIRIARSILAALVVGFVAFWLVRFGFWTDGLFTQRTALYWTASKVTAWALAVMMGGMAGFASWKAR
jgi:hypothetical protein